MGGGELEAGVLCLGGMIKVSIHVAVYIEALLRVFQTK